LLLYFIYFREFSDMESLEFFLLQFLKGSGLYKMRSFDRL
jgi:hypothetical protein